MKRFLLTLNPWLFEKVADYSKAEGISMRDVIRLALNEFFRKRAGL